MNVFKILMDNYVKIYSKRRARTCKKDMKKSDIKKIRSEYIISKEERADIDEFFLTNFGKTVDLSYHQYLAAFNGNMKKEYFPEVVFREYYTPMVNPVLYSKILQDKNFTRLFCNGMEGIRIPKTYATCSMGRYQDGKGNYISFEECIELLKNKGEVFCKPATETGCGKGVCLCDFQDGIDCKTGKTVKDIVASFGENFIMEEKIEAHDILKKIYPDSLNTFRVITYVFNNKIYHFPIALRIGQGGSVVDNTSAGGVFVGVSDDGKLNSYALRKDSTEKIYEHPDTKVAFGGYCIPQIKEIIEAAEAIHKRIPQLGMIAFDLSIDKDSNIVLVEINTEWPGIFIVQAGLAEPAFGENTAKILQWIRDNKK